MSGLALVCGSNGLTIFDQQMAVREAGLKS